MTGVQSRDESVANSSDDDEPLGKLVKRKRTSPRTHIGDETLGSPQKERSAKLPNSDSADDAAPKEAPAGDASPTDYHKDFESGHSSDDEPLGNLIKRKGSVPKSKHKRQKKEAAVQDSSDSEDDKPLVMLVKKKKKAGRGETGVQNAKKTKSPQKRAQAAKATKLRESSPSRVKSPQKRGRKGKEGTKRTSSVHSTTESPSPKKRGRPKKADRETKVACSDSSDDEPLINVMRKKKMKQAVVLLKRMSERDVITGTQGRCRKQSNTADISESSDEEPLTYKVKRLKEKSKPARDKAKEDPSSDDEPLVNVRKTQMKDKCGERTNGEEDKPKRDMGETKGDSSDEHQTKRASYEAGGSPHSEPSSS